MLRVLIVKTAGAWRVCVSLVVSWEDGLCGWYVGSQGPTQELDKSEKTGKVSPAPSRCEGPSGVL